MKSSICLNMIVRNERSVMKRCLESVLPWIDAWVVVDTGSSDGTQEVVREVLKDLPGALYERPWVDFSYNRTEALKLAKPWGDFALFIDADEELIVEKNFCWPDLQKMIYVTRVHLKELSAYRELLVDNRYDWYWEGVLHEQIYCRALINECGVIENAYNLSHPDSFRNLDREKFRKDADLLKKGLMKEPANSRYVFYLAQTLAAMGSWEEALGYYALRSRMGGGERRFINLFIELGFYKKS